MAFALARDEERKYLDGSQSIDDVLLTINVGVENTKNVLELLVLLEYEQTCLWMSVYDEGKSEKRSMSKGKGSVGEVRGNHGFCCWIKENDQIGVGGDGRAREEETSYTPKLQS